LLDDQILGLNDSLKKKKKKSRKSKGVEDDDTQEEIKSSVKIENGGKKTLLADVQHAKQFTLATSTVPEKMLPSEWPLLLKVDN